ncbi:putative transport protein [Ruminococcus sp. YRD2003]|uniref:aspartate-alanine antiporter-like transporter n=1 Tax=Ruminococcus sp. YRD2003 TaxID=1452313 RepID=UPI0008C6AE71|nr:putative transport protein [Ruminococcus flavefaciens]
MELFDGLLTVKSVGFLMFSVLLIAALGYILGRITIKGISLGTAGVFIVALVYGMIFHDQLTTQLVVSQKDAAGTVIADVSFVDSALKIVDNLGLILFVSAVGFIAGPNFFANFKKNFKSYVLLAIIIILSGGLACAGCIMIGRNFTDLDTGEFTALMSGLLSGALTSTPGFSAAKDAAGADLEPVVSVGYGIAYIFGVLGVVLFVQLIPKMVGADMAKERELLVGKEKKSKQMKSDKKLIHMDDFGIMPFALAAVLGIIIGSVKFKNFSLSTTGGCLLVALLFGHFGRIGSISIMPKDSTLKVFRELGLMFFLIGAGVSGGAKFAEYFQPIYFLYGMIMTIVPMIIGFLFAKYVLKLNLLNNLGSITGGMTSTPALGTLITTAGTEDVASAYAATYPVALISVVLVEQFIIMLFK